MAVPETKNPPTPVPSLNLVSQPLPQQHQHPLLLDVVAVVALLLLLLFLPSAVVAAGGGAV